MNVSAHAGFWILLSRFWMAKALPRGYILRSVKANRNIVLVGFMGTGKTSVGQRLAERMEMSFVDMDCLIEEREGKSIPRIFDEDGEHHFRALERALAQELAAGEGLVIGTGGGIVLDPDNIRDFSSNGLVVCLLAEPEVILARVATDTNRPLLAVDDKMKKILALLEQRRPLYEAIPHRVETGDLNVEEVAKRVIDIYKKQLDSSPDS